MSDVVLVLVVLTGIFIAGVQVGIWWQRENIGLRAGLEAPPPQPND
jgi:uncharacterized iron-regulated membrane protein